MTLLTLADLQKAIDLVFPVLYYTIDRYGIVKQGEVIHVNAGEFNPEYIVCHADDFERIKILFSERRLVDIKDEPPEEARKRLLAVLEKRYPIGKIIT